MMRQEILRLAWPVFIGQLAVMANGVIDTVMAGRLSPTDMAGVGVGASVYTTVYIGLMGTVLGLSPIVAHHYGAGRHAEIGDAFRQAAWLALLLAIPGCAALAWTGPWLSFSAPPPEVAEVTRDYLWAVAAGLPAALLFRVFYALNTAISLPRTVMYINLAGVALKVPLNALFMFGAEPIGLPALGGAGCGVSTTVVAWASLLMALAWLAVDRSYARFGLLRRGGPNRRQMVELLQLGGPIGASYLVEITSFTFMALFLARLGATASASHQIAANLTGVCYMGGLGIASATSTLVAQRLGAGDPEAARRYARTGLTLAMMVALCAATVLWLARDPLAHAYAVDAQVVAATVPLIIAVALFQVFDSLQTQFGFILRAYKLATAPMLVYVLAMWGIGLGGGYWVSFVQEPGGLLDGLRGEVSGALGFWVAGIVSLIVATLGLGALLLRRWRAERAAR